MAQNHIWSFSTVGGVKRVNLESGNDLLHLGSLDPKLWTALSCPVSGLEIDRKTLEWVDADKDGHIRVPEVIAATTWLCSVLKNPGDILKQESALPLAAINDGNDEGKLLFNSAKIILHNLGKTAGTISADDTIDMVKIFSGTPFNGDGVITEDSTADTGLLALLAEVMKYGGSVTDRNGKQGINADILAGFVAQCEQYAAWIARKDNNPGTVMPLGPDTPAAFDNFKAVQAKIDDYFVRCRLAAYDPRSTDMLNLQLTRVESITAQDLSASQAEIAGYPLAHVEAGKPLPLTTGLNPSWEGAMTDFARLTAAARFPGKDTMTQADWESVKALFAPYAQWLSEKAGTAVEPLGADRIREILNGSGKEQLLALIASDNAVARETENIIAVDKLVRYYRDLYTLLKNFVTFYDFYSPGAKAIFQAGTLYIDQRSCDLCIRVSDMGKQGTMASFSGIYLLYCECTSKSGDGKMTIAAGVTNGDIDNFAVGKNGIFYDRQGMDWDATIVKIVDNPISIRQAFFSPYRKVSRFVETQVNKTASAQDAKVSGDLTKGVENAPAKLDESRDKKEPPQPPFDVARFAGIFAAIGLALGAIGTTIAAVAGGFMKLAWWQMPLAIAGILLVVSGPSMLLAYLKLRKRNLAPILEANGWAINALVKVNIQYGNTLTHLATLPRGARININDPFTKKRKPVLPVVIAVLIVTAVVYYLLWKYGFVHIGK